MTRSADATLKLCERVSRLRFFQQMDGDTLAVNCARMELRQLDGVCEGFLVVLEGTVSQGEWTLSPPAIRCGDVSRAELSLAY